MGRNARTGSVGPEELISRFRRTLKRGARKSHLISRAREALLRLGRDPHPPAVSLKDYDHQRYGPFLGVSDEGSAAGAIREAALLSPKAQAFSKDGPSALALGVAVDAERLGGIGEVAVGPEEFADVWVECVDRVLMTTNVGTRVNLRIYRRDPRVILDGGSGQAVARAKKAIAEAFEPFVNTPDRRPRPLTVFVEIPRNLRMKKARSRAVLMELSRFVSSGQAMGKRRAPRGQMLGLAARVGWGPSGQAAAMVAMDLAGAVGVQTVIIDGVKRKEADAAISYAGLLDYFRPGLIGPLLRRAKARGIRLRAANLPDPDTIARGVWSTLATARGMGLHLGKYGCFPLTLEETARVVALVQQWTHAWSAAPVFFVDQGLLSASSVDVGHDLMRGLRRWLEVVRRSGARVVLIDTIDKATAGHLLRTRAGDARGYLGLRQVARIELLAAKLGIKVLWAGGLGIRDVFEMGRLGVFGVYVTSAAAATVPVKGDYRRDPGLAGVKEPQQSAVLQTKIMLEAGFLARRLPEARGAQIERAAEVMLSTIETGERGSIPDQYEALARRCRQGWREYWRTRTAGRK